MPEIKLGRLPDRSPVKVTISITPDLAGDLAAYAELYRDTYGKEEAIADLIPAILASFLESDRTFRKWRGSRSNA